jgi:type IV pilus assembly protein PilW
VGSTVQLNGASFSPVRVTAGSTGSDQLDVVFASNVDSGANVMIKGTSNGASVKLMSLLPAAVGDAVLLAPATAGAACLVRNVTAVAAATDDSPLTLTFANTGTHNAATFTTTPSFAEKDRVALLGALQWSRYSVNGTDLQLNRPLATGTGATTAVLVRNVMAFRAQYGIVGTAANASTLAGWQDAVDDTSGASAANWTSVAGSTVNRVRALRIGLVTRSAQREKADASGTCVASTSKPVLFGTTVEPDVTDWRCYRYRTAISVVPLRNVAW